jgi:exodeoxyribonuclease VII large subunit
LSRGFVILRDEAGQPVIRRAGLKAGQPLEAEFADGRAPLRAERD